MTAFGAGPVVSVRLAVPGDLAALRHFEQQIVAAERPFDPTLREHGVSYYDIERLLGNPDVRVLVAEAAGEPIGCGLARIDLAKPYLRHERQAYLGLMYVDPRFRGQGANRRILAALMDWCRGREVLELRLDVYGANDAAVRAYEKAGFAAHMLEMRLALNSGQQ